MTENPQIRRLTIEAQLAREFAERLEMEADAWLQVATGKRQKAVEYRMAAEALTSKAGMIRTASKPGRRKVGAHV